MGISPKEAGMRIDFGAKVRTKDGHDAGSVRRVIVDPSSQRVTGFVVSTSRLLGRDVIVAEDEFLSSSGDTITLDLTKAELDRQPSFEEADYTLPPVGWVAPLGYGLPADAYLLPVAVAPPRLRRDGRRRARAARGGRSGRRHPARGDRPRRRGHGVPQRGPGRDRRERARGRRALGRSAPASDPSEAPRRAGARAARRR
ncbi:MAG: PRC-barrel domain containing protein [Chloroflexi bacterium]|nr:MAG: PRC-barrel domain containing protein [Chloroflexota bacterium]